MSIPSPAKCEIRSAIRYLVWNGKPPIEVHNEVKTAFGDKQGPDFDDLNVL